jgi:hypothetical protein
MGMRRSKWIWVLAALVVAVFLTGGVCYLVSFRNPYHGKGLRVEWSYGYGGTVPTVEIWVDDYNGVVPAPIDFHGLTKPTLRFYDWNGDGRDDIVFRSKDRMQILEFYPRNGAIPPRFEVLRNDVLGD